MEEKKAATQTKVEQYSNLPYTVVIEKWDDGSDQYYVARVLELPGCMIHGNTPAEAVAELEEVKREWISTQLELGNEIPL